MRQIQLAELRDSWSAWMGVCAAFIATNFALALSALVQLTGVTAVRSGALDYWKSAAFTFGPAINLGFCAIVGASAIGAATSLVVDSRRGSLARLALSGATPGQVLSTIVGQLAVVSLACSLVGDALALVLLEPTLRYLASDPSEGVAVPTAVYAAWPLLLANVFAVGLALAGGYRQARAAGRIPPVEALRQASGGTGGRMSVGGWIGSGVFATVIVGAYAAIPALTAVHTKETFSNIFVTGLIILVVGAGLLARLAPLVVGRLTRAWTRWVPSFDPSWNLARSTTAAKADRLTKSVIPVMMAIGLLFGMVAVGQTMQSTLYAMGEDIELSGVGPGAMLTFLGLPLLIALSGGVGSLIMMSKQRSAELALSGIAGATPAQRLAMPVFEGLIIAVTGAILSVFLVATMVVFLAIALSAADFPFAFSPPYATFALAFAVCAAITVAATLLPTLTSLRVPEPRVIARLVAE